MSNKIVSILLTNDRPKLKCDGLVDNGEGKDPTFDHSLILGGFRTLLLSDKSTFENFEYLFRGLVCSYCFLVSITYIGLLMSCISCKFPVSRTFG